MTLGARVWKNNNISPPPIKVSLAHKSKGLWIVTMNTVCSAEVKRSKYKQSKWMFQFNNQVKQQPSSQNIK